MKGYRSDPTDYRAEYGYAGVCELKGERDEQEDRVVIGTLPSDVDLQQGDVITRALINLQTTLPRDTRQGSCAIACAIQSNTVYTANVGDSKAYVIRINVKGKVLSCRRINTLHNPNQPNEKKRLKQANFWPHVTNNRLGECLALSRAIGDNTFEDYGLSHTPDAYQTTINIPKRGKAFLIVACDGLTERIKGKTAEENYIKQMVQSYTRKNITLANLAEAMAKQAIVDKSGDNISVIIAPIETTSHITKLLAVFDGHAGADVAQHCHDHFMQELHRELE